MSVKINNKINDKQSNFAQRCDKLAPRSAPSDIIMNVYGRRATISAFGEVSTRACGYSSALNILPSGVVAKKCRKYNLNKGDSRRTKSKENIDNISKDLNDSRARAKSLDESMEFEKCLRQRKESDLKHRSSVNKLVSREIHMQLLNDWMIEKMKSGLSHARNKSSDREGGKFSLLEINTIDNCYHF